MSNKKKTKTTKNNKPNQASIKVFLLGIYAFLKTVIGWNKNSKPAITVEKVKGAAKSDPNTYTITARAIGVVQKAKSAFDAVAAGLPIGDVATGPSDKQKKAAKENPILRAVHKHLMELQLVDPKRYGDMVISIINERAIRVVMPSGNPVHLNFTINDLNRLHRAAVRSSGAKMISAWAEYNNCLMLCIMQGLITVRKDNRKPLMAVVAYRPKGGKHNEIMHMYSLVADGNQAKFIAGKRAWKASSKGRPVYNTSLHNALRDWRHTEPGGTKRKRGFLDSKGKVWNGLPTDNNRNPIITKAATDMLEEAVKAGVFKKHKWAKGMKFERTWVDKFTAAADGQHTLWGMLTSMTNSTNKGDTSHIKEKGLAKLFPNISLKRLLEGHPDEVSLLDEENKGILAAIRGLLGVDNYRIPAVYITDKKDWNPENDDDATALEVHPAWQAFMAREQFPNQIYGKGSREVEVLAMPDFNRFWNFTGVAHTIAVSEYSTLDLIGCTDMTSIDAALEEQGCFTLPRLISAETEKNIHNKPQKAE